MATAPRQSHLAAIHCAQKALGLSAEDASALKLAVTGQASSATMSATQRKAYLAHLSTLQQRAGLIDPRPAKRPQVQRSVEDYQDERWGKARALWHALAANGVVHTDTDAALAAYVKRQSHMEHWRFLNGYQINAVIEALKSWCTRTGIDVRT
ncbi:regulatory protein GemA [Rhodoferax sp.]|uniref:regulatory protein GemA n=1 Tax=Rhodoferax sp. TaxID=50421 RepID=UPI0025F3F8C0|nr:regulatory protein GemA [Rhodoferax sp.]MCM2340431.1 regulatory protein GemA [Rhodoferax sp.]